MIDIVVLQDPPVSKGFLPSFAGFKSFAPCVIKPRVACYVAQRFLSNFTVFPGFVEGYEDFMFLDGFTPRGCFGSSYPRFRIPNPYARALNSTPRSVPPNVIFAELYFPYLVASDLNLHNPASDPTRVISAEEEKTSLLYFERTSSLGFSLLNTPGVYTRFPLSGPFRPSVIDLSFANPHMYPAFRSWDSSSLPSTGSDHVPLLLTLSPPSGDTPPPTPKWG